MTLLHRSSTHGWKGTAPLASLLLCIAITTVFFSGCTAPAGTTPPTTVPTIGAREGDSVKVFYRVGLENGEVFESNYNQTPLEFTLGSGVMIKGFEQAVLGMVPGETKTVTFPPELGYGATRPEFIVAVPRSEFPDNFTPIVGGIAKYQTASGTVGTLTIVEFNETTITVDQNHPLAGKTLQFMITLSEIMNAKA
ncbi:MAG: peptidylprolyl isomerase [Methanomicrobiales archaeon]|nr:peptidylprolyl isomerase [Methanomicrobiales archaeon]